MCRPFASRELRRSAPKICVSSPRITSLAWAPGAEHSPPAMVSTPPSNDVLQQARDQVTQSAGSGT